MKGPITCTVRRRTWSNLSRKTSARAMGLTNVRFAVRDQAALTESSRYALITGFDAIHDQA